MSADQLPHSVPDDHNTLYWEQRIPEVEVMENAAENAAYDRMAARWLNKTIYPKLVKELNPQGVDTILDVCSGSGRLALTLIQMFPAATVHGIDLSPGMLELARLNARAAGIGDRLAFHLADAAAMPFENGQFDAALSYGSLHHWKDPQRVLVEHARVVRPGGQIIVGDWRREPMMLQFFSSMRGTPEWTLIEGSLRAAYRVDEVEALLEPLASLCEWRVVQHPMGLLIRGQVRPRPG